MKRISTPASKGFFGFDGQIESVMKNCGSEQLTRQQTAEEEIIIIIIIIYFI